MNKQIAGFTLVELLVVLVVLMSTGVVIGSILFSSLRGANKANILTTARQNGDYAISQMVKTIRNAKSFGGVSTCNADVDICEVPWVKDCTQSEGELKKYTYVNITSPSNEKIVYSCASLTISANEISLIDDKLVMTNTDPATADYCHFTCLQNNALDSPTIGIHFSLMQKGKAGVRSLSENTVLLPFSTSVRMRNSL